eukprot:scaffold2970_cov36-Cyclotella_meneghiniana.AAC.2
MAMVEVPGGSAVGSWSNHGRRTTPRKLEGRLEKDERMVSRSPRIARVQICKAALKLLGCCAAAVIAPAPDGQSTWRFNHGHLRSKAHGMLAAPCPSVDNSRRIRTAAAAHSDGRFRTKTDECAAAAVPMRRLLSTDGHGAASIPCAFDRRWPWLKCQVDRPSGGGAITAAAQHPFF